VHALNSSSFGGSNTAVGVNALFANNGNNNTAIGLQALYNNTTGASNTALGLNALFTNTTANFNTAIGSGALYQNTAFSNTAVGVNALNANTVNGNNTAVGVQALLNNTGASNTAVGTNAYMGNITGAGITALGAFASLNGWTNLTNATAIGYNAVCDDFNRVRIGNSGVLSIGGQVGWTNFSDGRFKKQIEEDVKGLEFIKRLRPVTYIVDLPGLDHFYNDEMEYENDPVMKEWKQKSLDHAASHRESGFIAQEVEEAMTATGFTFSGVDKPGNDRAIYGLRYGDFVVPLVKGMQEQQAIIENQQKIIDALVERVEALEKN
jgi:hypothetical protein